MNQKITNVTSSETENLLILPPEKQRYYLQRKERDLMSPELFWIHNPVILYSKDDWNKTENKNSFSKDFFVLFCH